MECQLKVAVHAIGEEGLVWDPRRFDNRGKSDRFNSLSAGRFCQFSAGAIAGPWDWWLNQRLDGTLTGPAVQRKPIPRSVVPDPAKFQSVAGTLRGDLGQTLQTAPSHCLPPIHSKI